MLHSEAIFNCFWNSFLILNITKPFSSRIWNLATRNVPHWTHPVLLRKIEQFLLRFTFLLANRNLLDFLRHQWLKPIEFKSSRDHSLHVIEVVYRASVKCCDWSCRVSKVTVFSFARNWVGPNGMKSIIINWKRNGLNWCDFVLKWNLIHAHSVHWKPRIEESQ